MSQFAVIFFNPNSGLYEYVNGDQSNKTWEAPTHEEAIDQASRSINQNGKFVAFPVPGATKASAIASLVGDNNDLKWEADTPGAAGSNIRFRYVVAGNNTALSVSVAGSDITVNVATNGSGVPTSTANAVLAAVNAHGTAGPMVTVTLYDGSDVGNNGTGIVAALDYFPLGGGHEGGAVATIVTLVEMAQQTVTTY